MSSNESRVQQGSQKPSHGSTLQELLGHNPDPVGGCREESSLLAPLVCGHLSWRQSNFAQVPDHMLTAANGAEPLCFLQYKVHIQVHIYNNV